MADLLNIALSGLNAHQRALSTTGHNIANVNTPGYSRQQVINETRPHELLGGVFLGTGVDANSVRRITDEFFVAQIRRDASALSEATILRQGLDQLDLLFADSGSGLNSALDRFFSSLQTASDEPTSIVSRQVLLSDAQNLVNRFDSIAAQLNNQGDSVNRQIDELTGSITVLAREIADLNNQIAAALGLGQGEEPNDLLDRREQRLRELSELVGINVVEQDNQVVNVFIGSGQALVLGQESFNLLTRPDPANPRFSELAISTGNTVSALNSELSGGILGGLLSFRDGALDSSLNSLGRIALGVIDSINAQHQLGLDLEGNFGTDFFGDINGPQAVASRTTAASTNSLPADQVVEANISDVSQLSTSDYQITFTAANQYLVTRLSDGLTNTAIDPSLTGTIAGLPATISFDGLSVNLDRPSGNFAVGDRFLLQPTRQAAANISLNLDRPEQIALAGPVSTEANLNNTGTGSISPSMVVDASGSLFATPGQLSPPLIIQFTSATTYDILDNTVPGAPVALAPPQTGLAFPPVSPNTLLPAAFGIDVAISGQPQTGDSFKLDFNTGGVQDNRNGLAMAEAQFARTLNNGTTSVTAAYGQLLQEVGTLANAARSNEEAGTALLSQSEARLQSIAGVNLDEEAANLIRFEQAYNASAQVINVARTLFDTLLNSVRA